MLLWEKNLTNAQFDSKIGKLEKNDFFSKSAPQDARKNLKKPLLHLLW